MLIIVRETCIHIISSFSSIINNHSISNNNINRNTINSNSNSTAPKIHPHNSTTTKDTILINIPTPPQPTLGPCLWVGRVRVINLHASTHLPTQPPLKPSLELSLSPRGLHHPLSNPHPPPQPQPPPPLHPMSQRLSPALRAPCRFRPRRRCPSTSRVTYPAPTAPSLRPRRPWLYT